jgi:hypothetical protein
MQSSAKTVRSSPAPISQPQPTPPPTPEDPLVVAAAVQIQAMDEMQMARAGGQILYDIAITDPTISVASPEILGMILKKTILNDSGELFPEWLPLLRLYVTHSLVAKDPRLVGMALCRMVTMQLYMTGKLVNANQANSNSA